MYKAIIVDDEQWIVEGLKAGVDWNGNGFEVVGAAGNGQDALELIGSLRPDFVLTDIKMPLMNGLELIQKGKELSPHTQFVVLSGHAEFAYAQKALNYGAFGYCLKPFEIDEIHTVLKRLSQTLADRRSGASPGVFGDGAELYEAMCSGRHANVKRLLEDSGMSVDSGARVTPIVVQSKSIRRLGPEINHLGFRMSMRRHGYLVLERHARAFLQAIIQAYGSEDYSVGVGEALSDLAGLEAAFEAASLAAYGQFSTGVPGVYDTASASFLHAPIDDQMKAIADALQRRDRIQFAACMNSARTLFHDGTFGMKEAYVLFTSVMYLFSRDAVRPGGKLFEGYEQLYAHFGVVDAMIDYLIEQTAGYFDEDMAAQVVGISHKKVKDILVYIRDNFTQELTIQALSDRFQLSPNYFCHLFKKEVGESFVEYVSRQRIQYACKLLAETSLSIHEISERCGFNDYFYFTRIFKRINGMTATQYREKTAAM